MSEPNINSRPTCYTSGGPRGGDCIHCELPRKAHEGPHEFCPIIVIYDTKPTEQPRNA